jgi:hypothetical protein
VLSVNPSFLIFALLFGFAGYGEASRFRKRYGRTPFGWPEIVWALVCFLSFLIGIILLAIGERIGRNAAAKAPIYGGSYTQPVYAAPAGYGPPSTYGPPAQHPLGYGLPVPQAPTYGPPVQQPPTYGAPAQPQPQPPQPPQHFNNDILPK